MGRPRSGAGFGIPAALARRGIDARYLPKPQLRCVSPTPVAARGEGRFLLGNFLQCNDRVGAACAGRIGLRPDHDEIVVHDIAPVHAPAFGDELLFRALVVTPTPVGIPPPPPVERLPGAHSAYPDFAPRLLLPYP